MTTLQYGGTAHQFGSIKHGEFSEDQRDNLEHLAQFLRLWFRWNPNYGNGKAPVSPHSGVISAAQEGIDWVIAKMSGAGKKTGPGSGILIAKNFGIDEVFAQLETLRGSPDVESDKVIAEIVRHVIHEPRSKLADAWCGGGDRSGADYAVCCEAIRRGAGKHVMGVSA